MKEHKITELEPCLIEMFDDTEAALLDVLLSRTIGQRMFYVKKIKKPVKVYQFMFWATAAERDALENAWDKVVQMKWNEFEERLQINKE